MPPPVHGSPFPGASVNARTGVTIYAYGHGQGHVYGQLRRDAGAVAGKCDDVTNDEAGEGAALVP